ncbi:MAG TPA: hypothetical protein HA302_07545 [Thermococcaceae archaeon]|uniref:Uncharacterized protein n=1 Tax=Thermococcus sibiricus (strain DSM 12597 / MM 739) TaxID=604354 RepID=C6A4F6_THESM|nr:hypothetical protein [Thermococcus sibiricus]ACS90501.1 hypothetical protein TSIB_1450 [Thermococcus sibiricus MM 739]HII67840.1 hypothetical protein [Thermococcaceae archaeon]
MRKSKVYLVVLILLTSAFPIGMVSGSELPDYAPTPSELNAIGIEVTDVDRTPDGVTFEGTFQVNNQYEPQTTEVKIAIFEYENPEKAREEFKKSINTLISGCYENKKIHWEGEMANHEWVDGTFIAKHVEKYGTSNSSTCYMFFILKHARSGYIFGAATNHEALYTYGKYVIFVGIYGGWNDYDSILTNPQKSYIYVVCSESECTGAVDEAKYQAYMNLLEERNKAVKLKAERLTKSVVDLVLKHIESTSPEGGYSVRITSPRDGATLRQLFDGYFTMSLWADVDGSGAENLYAVVTLPDGSKKRENVMGGSIVDIIEISDPTVKGGTVRVDLYGTMNGSTKLLASDSVKVGFVSKEVPGDNIDNDLDGLVDCDDPDIFGCQECILQKKLEFAENIYKRHVDYLNKVIELHPEDRSIYEVYLDDLNEIHDDYLDDPDRMVSEMNAYMEKKVYANQKINSYLSIFKDDPEKRYQLRQIAIKYRYDPIMRDIKMKDFIYKNAQSAAESSAIANAIIAGIIEPPQWLVGGQYGSGGALDWAHFIASNFEKVGDTVKFKGNAKVKMLRTPATVYLVALDAKALMDHARELQNMNLPENTRVSIVVLDGATKIGKLLDPTGYFGNMADATVGALIDLRKKIEQRNQGWFTWNGYVLHETSTPGIYEDYETGKKFRRVGGGWLSSPNFVEVKDNG